MWISQRLPFFMPGVKKTTVYTRNGTKPVPELDCGDRQPILAGAIHARCQLEARYST